jgi:hypothetical protein
MARKHSETETGIETAVATIAAPESQRVAIGTVVHFHTVILDGRTGKKIHHEEPARVEAIATDRSGAPLRDRSGRPLLELSLAREVLCRNCSPADPRARYNPQSNEDRWAHIGADGEPDFGDQNPLERIAKDKPSTGESVLVFFRDREGRVAPRLGCVVDDLRRDGELVHGELDIRLGDDPEIHVNVVSDTDGHPDRYYSRSPAPAQD